MGARRTRIFISLISEHTHVTAVTVSAVEALDFIGIVLADKVGVVSALESIGHLRESTQTSLIFVDACFRTTALVLVTKCESHLIMGVLALLTRFDKFCSRYKNWLFREALVSWMLSMSSYALSL